MDKEALSEAQVTDKEYARERKRIGKLIRKWARLLGVAHWDVEVWYYRELLGPPGPTYRTFMVTNTRWEYMLAIIKVDLTSTIGASSDSIEHMIIHEFCHVLMDEMKNHDKDSDHAERVAEQLAKAIWWTLRYGLGKISIGTISIGEKDATS